MVTSMLHSAVMFTFVELFRAFNSTILAYQLLLSLKRLAGVIGRRRKALAAAH